MNKGTLFVYLLDLDAYKCQQLLTHFYKEMCVYPTGSHLDRGSMIRLIGCGNGWGNGWDENLMVIHRENGVLLGGGYLGFREVTSEFIHYLRVVKIRELL